MEGKESDITELANDFDFVFLDDLYDQRFTEFCKPCKIVRSNLPSINKEFRVMAATYPSSVGPELTAGPYISDHSYGRIAVPGNLVAILDNDTIKYYSYPPDIDFEKIGSNQELVMIYGPRLFRVMPIEILLFHAYTSYFVSLYHSVDDTVLAPTGELVFKGIGDSVLRVPTFIPVSQLVSPFNVDISLAFNGAIKIYNMVYNGNMRLSINEAVNLLTTISVTKYVLGTKYLCSRIARRYLDELVSGKWVVDEIEVSVSEIPVNPSCRDELRNKGIDTIRMRVVGGSIVIDKDESRCPPLGEYLETGSHYVSPLTILC